MANKFDIHKGDCLEILKQIPNVSVDCVIDDLPYEVLNSGNANALWDKEIDLKLFWEQIWRICKPNAAVCLFGQGMFGAKLMMSQEKYFKYDLVWDKGRDSGFLNANRMPLRRHEQIFVFYKELPTYNPQKYEGREPTHSRGSGIHKHTNRCYGNFKETEDKYDGKSVLKFPTSILSFPRPHCTGNHPTEKSVDLCRWLIRSYTNKGEVVLDATMGSGTTGVAAMLEERRFIGIEKEENYFDISKRRIERAAKMPIQDLLFSEEDFVYE